MNRFVRLREQTKRRIAAKAAKPAPRRAPNVVVAVVKEEKPKAKAKSKK